MSCAFLTSVHWRFSSLCRLRVFLCVAVSTGLMLFSQTSSSASAQVSEYQIKAAFVFNFIKFTEFTKLPADRDRLVICTLGGDDVIKAFEPVRGLKLGSRTIDVVALDSAQPGSSVSEQGCSALFISRDHMGEASMLFRNCKGKGVLTAGESPDFIERGGVLNFYQEDSHVRFEVNLAAAETEGLRISSRPLSLGRIRKEPG